MRKRQNVRTDCFRFSINQTLKNLKIISVEIITEGRESTVRSIKTRKFTNLLQGDMEIL